MASSKEPGALSKRLQSLSTAVKAGTAAGLGLSSREKARTMTLFLSPDLHTLLYTYRSAKLKRDVTWRLALRPPRK